jgi:hypothetical protein
LDARHQALQAQQAVWETQKAEIAEKHAVQKAEIERLQAEVRNAQSALADEHRQLELQREEAFVSQSREAEQLAARQAELDARRQSLESQQAAWEAQKTDVQRTLDDRVAGLDALRVDLDSQRLALEKERRQWESQCRDASAAQSMAVEQLSEREAELDARRLASEAEPVAEDEAVKTIPTSDAAPVDLAAVLRQTGFQVEQADEERQCRENVHFKGESAASGPAEDPSADISAPVPRNRKPAESGAEAEVSIDEYMSRLLARSRGDSAPASGPASSVSRAPAAVKPVAVPKPSPAPVVPAAQGEPSKPDEAVAMAPRAVAPERQVNFIAMRQLANQSANSALQKHESKQLLGSKRTKLLVTSVSAVVGVSLLAIHLLPGAPAVTTYGAVASFAVAALWGMNYLSLMSRVAGERMAYMSRHLKAGDAPATKVEEEEP